MGRMIVRRWALVGAAVVCGATACRGRESANGPYGREVAEAIPRIEEATGLKFKQPPKVEVRSKEQVREFLLKKFDETSSAQQIAGEESAYKLLGLIPDSMDLRKFFLSVLTEQVIGYYDPAPKVLYVVKGADEQMVGVTLTHELVHALQDQYINLDSLQKASSDNDRLTAAQALIEGQAQFEQLAIMVGGAKNIASRLPGGWERIRDVIREKQSEMPIFATAPMLVQESLLFPYLSGADFVRRFKERNGNRNPFTNVPRSTEQVLHTDAYFSATPDEPSTVTLPAPRGAAKVYENDLGEFGARLFLYQHVQDPESAARAASGWDGDRYVVVQGPGGRGIVWVSVWDGPLQAAGFTDALTRATAKRTGAGERNVAGGGATFATKGRTVSILPRTIAGRPVIVYSDLPDAMRAGPIDPSAITIVPR